MIEADRKIHDLNKRKEVKVGNMSLDDVKSLKKRANRGAWSQAKEKVGVNVSVEKVQSFEEAFGQAALAAVRHEQAAVLVAVESRTIQ